MISIIYSTHKDEVYNNNFKNHILRSVGVSNVQILQFQNNNEYSLAEVYNRGISQSENDIVVCIHNDIKLETNWGKKLLQDFQNNPDYSIIGKAGTAFFPESGVYWERLRTTMVGQVYHHPPTQKKFLSRYSVKLPHLVPVVSIDGLFMAFDKTKIKHRFDETIGKFHFYDHTFCLLNYLDGIKIGVTSSFDITHESIGKPSDEFYTTKELFINKFKQHLPLDLRPKEVFYEEIKSKPIKNCGKVAVVIPTKSKLDLLFDCLDSFRDKTQNVDFEVFVADTGSSIEEKESIKEYIHINENQIKINLIEYDYYNFSKINNDVVKNHVGNEFEYILFSNNDIKLLNNVMYGMVSNFKKNPKVGTVGARLHFQDNTVQHDGILAGLTNQNTEVALTHRNLTAYYNFSRTQTKVIGNTGGLLMIRKKLFDTIGGFNENYRVCFEDVELNFECIARGFENIHDGNLVAYHYESQTRKNDPEEIRMMVEDMKNILLHFTLKHIQKLNPYLTPLR